MRKAELQIRQAFGLNGLLPTVMLCCAEGNFNNLHAHLYNGNTSLEDSLLLLLVNYLFQLLHLLKTASLYLKHSDNFMVDLIPSYLAANDWHHVKQKSTFLELNRVCTEIYNYLRS